MADQLLHLLFLFLLHSFSIHAEQIPQCDGEPYTVNSTFESNLHLLLSNLSSSNSIFSTATIGASPEDRVYGLVLCRGDQDPSYCTACYKMLSYNITRLCPLSIKATMWDRHCELRYSGNRFFGFIETPEVVGGFRNSMSLYSDAFANMSKVLFENVSYQAAFNSSLMMFATGMISSSSWTVYSYAQCTMDLSRDMCSQCLNQVLTHYWSCCRQYIGGWFYGKSCNYGYEISPFYLGDPALNLTYLSPASPPPAPTPIVSPPASHNTGGKKKSREVLTMVISLGVTVVFLQFIRDKK